jgi:hypothetical protein
MPNRVLIKPIRIDDLREIIEGFLPISLLR